MKDLTFLYFGVFITIVIPIILLLFSPVLAGYYARNRKHSSIGWIVFSST